MGVQTFRFYFLSWSLGYYRFGWTLLHRHSQFSWFCWHFLFSRFRPWRQSHHRQWQVWAWGCGVCFWCVSEFQSISGSLLFAGHPCISLIANSLEWTPTREAATSYSRLVSSNRWWCRLPVTFYRSWSLQPSRKSSWKWRNRCSRWVFLIGSTLSLFSLLKYWQPWNFLWSATLFPLYLCGHRLWSVLRSRWWIFLGLFSWNTQKIVLFSFRCWWQFSWSVFSTWWLFWWKRFDDFVLF